MNIDDDKLEKRIRDARSYIEQSARRERQRRDAPYSLPVPRTSRRGLTVTESIVALAIAGGIGYGLWNIGSTVYHDLTSSPRVAQRTPRQTPRPASVQPQPYVPPSSTIPEESAILSPPKRPRTVRDSEPLPGERDEPAIIHKPRKRDHPHFPVKPSVTPGEEGQYQPLPESLDDKTAIHYNNASWHLVKSEEFKLTDKAEEWEDLVFIRDDGILGASRDAYNAGQVHHQGYWKGRYKVHLPSINGKNISVYGKASTWESTFYPNIRSTGTIDFHLVGMRPYTDLVLEFLVGGKKACEWNTGEVSSGRNDFHQEGTDLVSFALVHDGRHEYDVRVDVFGKGKKSIPKPRKRLRSRGELSFDGKSWILKTAKAVQLRGDLSNWESPTVEDLTVAYYDVQSGGFKEKSSGMEGWNAQYRADLPTIHGKPIRIKGSGQAFPNDNWRKNAVGFYIPNRKFVNTQFILDKLLYYVGGSKASIWSFKGQYLPTKTRTNYADGSALVSFVLVGENESGLNINVELYDKE